MKRIVIHATWLYDGVSKKKDQYIIVENDKIIEVSSKKQKADYSGIVTPALIDGHSHIGMMREGEPHSEDETNDITDQFNPLNDPLHSIYFDDRAFKDAVDFGVLYSCVMPGSGNLIAGQSQVIRNFSSNAVDCFVRNSGMKMALGYNPRSTTEWRGSRPNTRMGIYALLEKKFDDLLMKREKELLSKDKKLRELSKKKIDDNFTEEDRAWEKALIEKEFDFAFSNEELEYLQILDGNKLCRVHVHKQDDICYLIELKRRYGLRVTVEHALDVHQKEIFDMLAKEDIPVIYGPIGGIGGKTELKHAYYQNAKLLLNSSVSFCVMTDHPVVNSIALRDTMKYFLIHGMNEVEAVKAMTSETAKIIGVDDILGSVEAGKLASLVVWNMDPFHLGAFPQMVMAEGKVIRK